MQQLDSVEEHISGTSPTKLSRSAIHDSSRKTLIRVDMVILLLIFVTFEGVRNDQCTPSFNYSCVFLSRKTHRQYYFFQYAASGFSYEGHTYQNIRN